MFPQATKKAMATALEQSLTSNSIIMVGQSLNRP